MITINHIIINIIIINLKYITYVLYNIRHFCLILKCLLSINETHGLLGQKIILNFPEGPIANQLGKRREIIEILKGY